MQKNDALVVVVALGVVAVFALVQPVMDGFIALTSAHPFLMSAVKFAVLATFGECIGLRIATGRWNKPGFGILPKALVWALLGIGIRAAFSIFIVGGPKLLVDMGLPVDPAALAGGSLLVKLPLALAFSVTINFIFAPVFMTLHKVTDLHIEATGGTLRGFFSPIDMAAILGRINWKAMWGFVFKKTLPLFWVPAHTITFLIPGHFQVLYAAILGIVLGVFLAVAGKMKARSA